MARRTQPSVPHAQLDAIANESSERERLADQAERELFERKKMLLMEQHLGDMFEAIIIGIRRDGFSIELIDHFVEGFVPVAEIPNDSYRLDPSLHALVGRHTRQHFRLDPAPAIRNFRAHVRAWFQPHRAVLSHARHIQIARGDPDFDDFRNLLLLCAVPAVAGTPCRGPRMVEEDSRQKADHAGISAASGATVVP